MVYRNLCVIKHKLEYEIYLIKKKLEMQWIGRLYAFVYFICKLDA